GGNQPRISTDRADQRVARQLFSCRSQSRVGDLSGSAKIHDHDSLSSSRLLDRNQSLDGGSILPGELSGAPSIVLVRMVPISSYPPTRRGQRGRGRTSAGWYTDH